MKSHLRYTYHGWDFTLLLNGSFEESYRISVAACSPSSPEKLNILKINYTTALERAESAVRITRYSIVSSAQCAKIKLVQGSL